MKLAHLKNLRVHSADPEGLSQPVSFDPPLSKLTLVDSPSGSSNAVSSRQLTSRLTELSRDSQPLGMRPERSLGLTQPYITEGRECTRSQL